MSATFRTSSLRGGHTSMTTSSLFVRKPSMETVRHNTPVKSDRYLTQELACTDSGIGGSDVGGSDIDESDIEEFPVVGTKRNRDRDDAEENSFHTPETPAALNHAHQIAAIATRAKRMRISDNVPNDRDLEVHEIFGAGKKVVDKESASRLELLSPDAPLIPEQPSLSGLPEELIVEILQELNIFDVMALRRTNQRLSHITRARVLWIAHFFLLLKHVQLSESPVTFLPSLLSTRALERIVLRPHIFDYKWFRSTSYRESPASFGVLSAGWSKPQEIRTPILLPGGRWLIAVCDDGRSFNSNVCLWDLDHGRLKWLPEAQTVAEGRIVSLDAKMDKTGAFSLFATFSEKTNAIGVLVYRVDVYKVVFMNDTHTCDFHHIDSLTLNDRRAYEIQIYPQYGRVLVDLFDRVLVWVYSPLNMCAWMVTSKARNQLRRFSHRSTHAMTHTHKHILVADGDESVLRVFHLPRLMHRPAQLSVLELYVFAPYLDLRLPSYSTSLRFSTERLVDISTTLETQDSLHRHASIFHNLYPSGPAAQPTNQGSSTHESEGKSTRFYSDPYGRDVLFIDAASCDSYILCSFPIHDISSHPDSSQPLFITSKDRWSAREQARSGSHNSLREDGGNFMQFFVPIQMGGRTISGGRVDALWVGTISCVPTGPGGNQNCGTRNVVLMRSPDYEGGLMILSAPNPPMTELEPGQSRITEVEQGLAKTVLWRPSSATQGASVNMRVHVEAASVDQISGRVCVVETTTVVDWARNESEVRYALRLLEYA